MGSSQGAAAIAAPLSSLLGDGIWEEAAHVDIHGNCAGNSRHFGSGFFGGSLCLLGPLGAMAMLGEIRFLAYVVGRLARSDPKVPFLGPGHCLARADCSEAGAGSRHWEVEMKAQQPDALGKVDGPVMGREDLKRILLALLVIGAFAFAEIGVFWFTMDDPVYIARSSSAGPSEEQGLEGDSVPSAGRLPYPTEKRERHYLEAWWGFVDRAIFLGPNNAASGGSVDTAECSETPIIRPVVSGLPVGDGQCR